MGEKNEPAPMFFLKKPSLVLFFGGHIYGNTRNILLTKSVKYVFMCSIGNSSVILM